MATRKVTVHLDRIRQHVADHDDPNWPFPADRRFPAPPSATTRLPTAPLRAPAAAAGGAAAVAVIGVLGAAALSVGALLAGRQLVRRARRFDLTDRLVLITGGSRGLGLLLAREYAKPGLGSQSAPVTRPSWSGLGGSSPPRGMTSGPASAT